MADADAADLWIHRRDAGGACLWRGPAGIAEVAGGAPPRPRLDARRDWCRRDRSGPHGRDRERARAGTIVSPRASIATSDAIFFARPAAVFIWLVRNASANRFLRSSV